MQTMFIQHFNIHEYWLENCALFVAVLLDLLGYSNLENGNDVFMFMVCIKATYIWGWFLLGALKNLNIP